MPEEKSISQLLARIAQLEADKVELQKATVKAKELARDSHSRYQDANGALANYTVSYAKRLREKDNLIDENTNMEKAQLGLNEQIARYARQVSDMINKAREMDNMNGELQKGIAQLVREKAALQRRVDELEAVREDKLARRDAGDGRIRHFYGGGESHTPRYDNERVRSEVSRDARSRPRRSNPAYDGRYDAPRPPPTGPRAERRWGELDVE